MGKEIEIGVYPLEEIWSQIIENGLNQPKEYGLNNAVLDQHLKVILGMFIVIQGLPSSGKTTWTMWFFARLAKIHGLRFTIFTGENDSWELAKKIIEFAFGTPFNLVDEKQGKDFIENYFTFIREDRKKPYTADELMDLFEVEDSDMFLIDPHTSLDLGRSAHDYNANLNFIQRVRHFVKTKRKTLFLSLHVTVEAQRRIHPTNHADFGGLIMPPEPSHGAGGVWFNRCDNLYTVHRYVHAREKRFKETNMVYVDKVKYQDTGIYPTSREMPLQFKKVGMEYDIDKYSKDEFSQADMIKEYEDKTPF